MLPFSVSNPLINLNFNHVNAFGPDMNLFQPVNKPGEPANFGRTARGMSRKYAQGLWDHKHAVFKSFQQLLPGSHNRPEFQKHRYPGIGLNAFKKK
jgi:hypothetical protein